MNLINLGQNVITEFHRRVEWLHVLLELFHRRRSYNDAAIVSNELASPTKGNGQLTWRHACFLGNLAVVINGPQGGLGGRLGIPPGENPMRREKIGR